ncbi:NACHT domain-containing protein [Corallococcus sp. bb12-1]|uniref:NACHT domain-containing protein n=1 Tax=Corallococcus sp. bb12-1 TaxID=2996784 RepID=UPI00226FD343|nr:NACHT domain-containing protein [Corallococcus sp. bb12-1]MCY1042766.1 NACHT domain-containing protein [Corallococcus sp. bb12-1]
MATQSIPWQRFWIPRGEALALSDEGYLLDRQDAASKLVSLQALLSTHCVALLGEPGMGKTTTLRQERQSIQGHCDRLGAHLLWHDLAAFGDEGRLARVLFDGDVIAKWKKGDAPLYLVLDSFDECHLRIETLSKVLLHELRELPRERLFLFIACRPAHWPRSLEKQLRELWTDEAFAAVELAPLRRRDVEQLAQARHVDAAKFLQEVAQRNATALALRPVTLGFLLGAFKQGRLPADRWTLYMEGCGLLAQENDESRVESGQQGRLGTDARLAVASRLAALTLLSNRDAIQLGPPDLDAEASHGVRLGDATGGEEEEADGRRVPITEENLREALSTGLFGTGGPRLAVWAHRTYAEFLTALFLMRRKLPREQLASLFRHPEDAGQLIVPQLQEVAAWLASQDDDFREFLLETDPWVLLRSDALTASPLLRERLVDALLGTLTTGTSLGREMDARLDVHRLAHPGLGEQLRRHLRSPSDEARVLTFALDIVGACAEHSLAPVCADIALDARFGASERLRAIQVLGELADEEAQARLLPLSSSEADGEERGRLREEALTLLWPRHVSTEQIIDMARAHPWNDYLGMRFQAAWEKHLPIPDLPKALRKIAAPAREGESGRHSLAYRELCTTLFQKAWQHLEVAEVFEAFCSAVWVQVTRREDVLPGARAEMGPLEGWNLRGEQERWLLIDGLATTRAAPGDLRRLKEVRPPLFFPRDLHPLLQRALGASSPEEQSAWAELAAGFISGQDATLEAAINEATKQHPLIAHAFAEVLGRKAENPPKEDPRLQRCEQLLLRIEGGEPGCWPKLVQLLSEPKARFDLFASDQYWNAVPGALQSRIAMAGATYIKLIKPPQEPWLRKGGPVPWEAWTGYAALMLLARVAPVQLDDLPTSVWGNWASLILTARHWESDTNHELRKHVVSLATRHAPDTVKNSFRRKLAAEEFGPGAEPYLECLRLCWNDVLVSVALEAFNRPALTETLWLHLLWILIEHVPSEVQPQAEQRLNAKQGTPQDLRIQIAQTLLWRAPRNTWERVWPLLHQDVVFGRAVMDALEQGLPIAIHLNTYSPAQLADIYLWIERHAGARAPRSGSRFLSVMNSGGDLHSIQGNIEGFLLRQSSRDACRALERLNHEVPGRKGLRIALIQAQESFRTEHWRPPGPRDLLALLGSPQARIVQSAAQLIDVVMESLGRLQVDLHGETPALEFLWNEWKEKNEPVRFRPKKENHLSDWIKRHLAQELSGRRIVVNREVEIRPTEPLRPGQRTDLLVQAMAAGPDGREAPISVIIEVKGCWNPDLWTAMREQLVERYLAENACQHGIYLVGWYACAHWDETQAHPTEGGVITQDRARQCLEEQATELSRIKAQVRAFVLDAAFRVEREAPPPARKRR